MVHIQGAEKLHAQTPWGDRGGQNADLLARNYMSEMRPCNTMDRQIRSKVGHQAKPLKYSEKKVIFHTNLEQMLNVQPRHSSQWRSRDWHVHSVHVNSVSYLLWHTWRVICLEGWTQNLTRVCIAVKLTSTWAELLNIHEAYGAVYGTGREAYKIYQEQFPKSVCQDYIKFDSVNHCLG